MKTNSVIISVICVLMDMPLIAFADCFYSLSPSSASYPGGGTNATFDVINSGGCGWRADYSVGWLSADLTWHIGSATVIYNVQQNDTGNSRTGTITAGDQTFTVNQTACTYSLSSSSASYPGGGTNATFDETNSGGCGWRAD